MRESLKGTPCLCIERRTRIDIVFEKTVEHVDVETKQCPECDATVKGEFPPDFKARFSMEMALKRLSFAC